MNLYETLITWPRERLAKELQGQARDNAALRRRVLELEVQLFWMMVAEAAPPDLTPSTTTMPAPGGFGVIAARPRTPAEAACWCSTCRPVTLDDCRMVLCPTCGNKRCPRAADHRNECRGSNEPGQAGSTYPRWPAEKETPP